MCVFVCMFFMCIVIAVIQLNIVLLLHTVELVLRNISTWPVFVAQCLHTLRLK
jgi:hypothetical protein